METLSHCNVCGLCSSTEQSPGSLICKNRIKDKFCGGYWHNGTVWHVLKIGRVLTKSTFNHTKKVRQARTRNKETSLHIATIYTEEHNELLHEWSNDISGFQREGQMEKFKFYMTTHPFSTILEYRLHEILIGFSWLVVIDEIVIQQLFPWRKKRFSKLSLGTYENEMLLELWPAHTHLLGIETSFKSKFGGWLYEGPIEPGAIMARVEKEANML